jgi:hypothetical protein
VLCKGKRLSGEFSISNYIMIFDYLHFKENIAGHPSFIMPVALLVQSGATLVQPA